MKVHIDKKGGGLKVRTGKIIMERKGRSRGGLQIPEVINKSVSSRTPMMI